jgi:hypothetical protein
MFYTNRRSPVKFGNVEAELSFDLGFEKGGNAPPRIQARPVIALISETLGPWVGKVVKAAAKMDGLNITPTTG